MAVPISSGTVKRKPLSKRTRFEVFKRDGFTCQFCGNTPPAVILEVDHLVPLSKGGVDEIINLLTSCEGCNRGKSDRLVTQISSPDARPETLRIHQEVAEAKRFLNERLELDRINLALISYLRDQWSECFGRLKHPPADRQIKAWLANFSPDTILDSWRIVGEYTRVGKRFESSNALCAYIAGVCKNKRSQNGQ